MQKPGARSRPSLSVRIDLDAEGRIGPGNIQLRENIHACARDQPHLPAGRDGMSDRRQERRRRGADPFGLSLVARYRKIEREAASAVKKEFAALRSGIGRPGNTPRADNSILRPAR
jgi:molybdate transport system regulatory protein